MSLLPVIALVGRPNVGKSTLFNRLTKSRDALVANLPGLTRDRQYGQAYFQEQQYIVVDTGGITGDEEGVDGKMAEQSMQAAQEADAVIFLTDAKAGVTPSDYTIVKQLRLLNKTTLLVVNKIDGIESETALAEFHDMGFGSPVGISASQGRGVKQLLERVFDHLFEARPELDASNEVVCDFPEEFDEVAALSLPEKTFKIPESVKLAIIGRPNVGKSTLVNRILGEERVVVFDLPGTTRDSIYIDMERNGKKYTLIDTAGVRKRGKISQTVEKFSVVKTLQAIEDSNVVMMVVDARVGITDQDLSLLGFVLDSGRSLVIAINKWDNMETEHKEHVKEELRRRLHFVDFAKIHYISALHGTGVGDLLGSVTKAFNSAYKAMTTRQLTEWLMEAQHKHQPPLVHGRRAKLRMAHVGGHNPPWIVVHGNLTQSLPLTYQKFLTNFFVEKLKLVGTPVRFEFKSSENPFASQVKELTPAQKEARKRAKLAKKIESEKKGRPRKHK
ncbi:MAG: ribosome biogenesis GTPase Der [Gammaproteobacteria bacterium CG22_combo_CG10-13_8_21_14_all_40_8]|nr:MAG: ribosome biogenesis GTPase Der [Gammaproteobacteria bacterium CG22_combo_CG10-13_8_21_14_all_40_8]